MYAQRVKGLLAAWILAAAQAALAAGGWEAGTALPDLAGFGLEGTLPALKGQVAVLDFWASWCGPCRASFPELQALHARYKDQGVVFLGINMDTDAKKMTTFLADHPVTFPVVRDAGQKVAKSAKIPAMPTTVIVGKDGVIREIHAGFTVKDGPAKLTAAIDQALKEAGK